MFNRKLERGFCGLIPILLILSLLIKMLYFIPNSLRAAFILIIQSCLNPSCEVFDLKKHTLRHAGRPPWPFKLFVPSHPKTFGHFQDLFMTSSGFNSAFYSNHKYNTNLRIYANAANYANIRIIRIIQA